MKKYIYNKYQALKFINYGVPVIDIYNHSKTGNLVFVFEDTEKFKTIFDLWCKRALK